MQQNLVLIREAEHMFSIFHLSLHLLFHHRNPISEAFSYPLQGKITGSNTIRKQSHAMVENLLPPSEITTFTLYVCDPPKHRQSSSVTHTHLYALRLQIISDVELLGVLRGNP